MTHFRSFALKLCVVAFAAAVGFFALTNRSYGSCGDYVHVGERQTRTEHDKHAPVPMPAKPCDGPNCSQSPGEQPVTTAPATSLTFDDWAQAVLSRPEFEEADRGFASVAISIFRIHVSRSIFHPPRFV